MKSKRNQRQVKYSQRSILAEVLSDANLQWSKAFDLHVRSSIDDSISSIRNIWIFDLINVASLLVSIWWAIFTRQSMSECFELNIRTVQHDCTTQSIDTKSTLKKIDILSTDARSFSFSLSCASNMIWHELTLWYKKQLTRAHVASRSSLFALRFDNNFLFVAFYWV